jgi:prepilin-type N-terminal cleavage/methylation domain-containing protein
MRRASSGFTLIELAVVLLIIGLVLGGVVVGQSLVRQAGVRSIAADVGKYIDAIKQFQDKYGALPGDMSNATSYWGANAGGCPAPYTTTKGAATCNGNGDGNIYLLGDLNFEEMYQIWQHLADAAMIEGSYTGATGSGAGQLLTPGLNTPQRGGGGYTVLNATSADVARPADFFAANYRHVMLFGAPTDIGRRFTMSPVLTSEEGLSIDNKLDDGSPATGKILSYQNGSTFSPGGCSTTNVSSTAAYNTGSTGQICALIFMLDF